MKTSLSTTSIARLAPAASPYEVHDTRLPGLVLRVQPTGRKTYYLAFRRGQRVKLGPAAVLSPAQARGLAKDKLASAYRGEDPRGKRRDQALTYRVFVEDIYRPWAEVHHKRPDASLRRLRRRFPELMRKRLDAIDLWQVERWRTARLREGRNPTTINRDTDGLKALLNKARLWGYLDVNPIAELRRLRVDRSPVARYLTPEEESRLRQALQERDARIRQERRSANAWRAERSYPLLADLDQAVFADHLHPMVLVSLNTGLRQGEVFSLHWSDIDLSRRVLTVRGDSAKSGQTRHLPLNDEAHAVLRLWRTQAPDASGLVFPGRNGQRFNNVHTSWKQVLADASITNFRWHDMRHHFASSLVMASVDLNTVRELLGHASYQMTLRYAHLAPDHKADAVAKLVAGDFDAQLAIAGTSGSGAAGVIALRAHRIPESFAKPHTIGPRPVGN